MLFPGFERRQVEGEGALINVLVGGEGPPLLLLHGYPQTHAMWHKVAPRLATDFTVIAPDLRGYGDSGKPPSGPDHAAYSKRATANDMTQVMITLGHERFFVAGHDRGGRVTHRMILDHPERIARAAVLDIVPTRKLFSTVNQQVATGYYHWFFLAQPFDLPERLIGSDPEYYLRRKIGGWSGDLDAFVPEALSEYIRCFNDPQTIHASCEDYRAAASIDLQHDEADKVRRIECPLLVLWGAKGLMQKAYDVLETWQECATDVRGQPLPCGHFLPEEAPDETYAALSGFFR